MSRAESPAELVERLRAERQAQPRLAPPPVRVAITGGRAYIPDALELRAFFMLLAELGASELHHGDAPGVDRFVAAAARRRLPGLTIHQHTADWSGQGRAAGPIRNRAMMTRCEILIAFPGGRGTDSCIREARAQGRRIIFVRSHLEAFQDSIEKDHLPSPQA